MLHHLADVDVAEADLQGPRKHARRRSVHQRELKPHELESMRSAASPEQKLLQEISIVVIGALKAHESPPLITRLGSG